MQIDVCELKLCKMASSMNLDKGTDSMHFLKRINGICEWISEIFLKTVFIAFFIFGSVAVFGSMLIAWLYDNFTVDHFYRPSPIMFVEMSKKLFSFNFSHRFHSESVLLVFLGIKTRYWDMFLRWSSTI